MKTKILVIGSCGQIGTELTIKLREIYGDANVIASDIKEGSIELMQSGTFEFIDAANKDQILGVVQKHEITQVYLLAAMLSATAEKYPQKAWDLNMNSLLAVLDLARENYIQQVYWPSSIAVFGPNTPKTNTPQDTVMQPSTVYGISKLSGEFWCNYYHEKFGVDVRSLRYPGIISYKTKPGGGTTDYAVDIFFSAVEKNEYTCFLNENTRLPMMYMDDAINATIKLMQSDAKNITIRTSYNLSGFDCTPEEIASEIKKIQPDFRIDYQPDFRQKIADSWPNSIDDAKARNDWHWKEEFDLEKMANTMLQNLKK
ncbi:MAG: NAD-dependent epimerase/dehydratase family protein [Polaribacter sp.]|nr:NAD-dependent epimerase/dehydratase family protein [Polaribacter sp.]